MSQEPDAPTDDGEPLTVRAAEQLQAAVVGLQSELKASEERSAAQATAKVAAEKAERRKWQRRLTIAVAFDVVMTLALATVLSGQASTNSQLKRANQQIQESLRQNYVTAQQQLVTRTELLCPLYGALLGVASNQSPTPMTAAQKKARDDAIDALRKGYTRAACLPKLS
jgi:hypothetical protein